MVSFNDSQFVEVLLSYFISLLNDNYFSFHNVILYNQYILSLLFTNEQQSYVKYFLPLLFKRPFSIVLSYMSVERSEVFYSVPLYN